MNDESTRNQFYSMFLDRLRELYSGEQLIVDALPMLLNLISSNELRAVLEEQMDKSNQHMNYLNKEFSNLHESPKGLFSESMDSMLQECQYLKTKQLPNIVKEAALITSLQKILHYQIAGYGALKTFAKHLELQDLYDILKGFLAEKSNLDAAFTEVAEGGYFTKGINEEAVE